MKFKNDKMGIMQLQQGDSHEEPKQKNKEQEEEKNNCTIGTGSLRRS